MSKIIRVESCDDCPHCGFCDWVWGDPECSVEDAPISAKPNLPALIAPLEPIDDPVIHEMLDNLDNDEEHEFGVYELPKAAAGPWHDSATDPPPKDTLILAQFPLIQIHVVKNMVISGRREWYCYDTDTYFDCPPDFWAELYPPEVVK